MPDPVQPQADTPIDYGAVDFDQLFPADGSTLNTPVAQPVPPDGQPVQSNPATPQAIPQVSQEPFLKTSTGTVYKTSEEAVRGIEHKDQLVEQLRQEFIQANGYDPITKRPVGNQNQPAQPASAKPQTYLEGDQYLNDLLSAANKGDARAYTEVQARFAAEIAQQVMNQTLGPLAPLITQFAQTSALERVSSEIQDFRQFRGTPEYSQTLGEFPDLKSAIETAESNPSYYEKLPQLYKLVYRAAYGTRVPELVTQAQATAQPQPRPATPQVRPTTSTSSMPAVATLETPGSRPGLNTSEGRKALIADLERRGIGDLAI